MVVTGVHIDALLATKAKSNWLSIGNGIGCGQRAQAQQRAGQQVDDFLLRVPGLVGRRWYEEGLDIVHGKHSSWTTLAMLETERVSRNVFCGAYAVKRGGTRSCQAEPSRSSLEEAHNLVELDRVAAEDIAQRTP
jgi:hypothetical protein